jgi:hypothetical protein
MRRPVILAGSPRIADIFQKDTSTLFDETGGNTGNLAFRYGLASHTKDVLFSHWGAPVDEVRAAADVLLLPLANQLGPHTDLGNLADRIEAFGLPVVGIGLGAQAPSAGVDVTLTTGTERWLRTMIAHAPSDSPNVGVRGVYTQQQIARLGLGDKVAVTGCPSNFINMHDDVAKRLAEGYAGTPQQIAVTAGIPYIPRLKQLEQQLAQLVTDTGGAYIVQHGKEMLHLARNEFELMGPEKLELCRDYVLPDADVDAFRTWCRRYAYAFFDVPGWMDFLKRFDFVVGTRFHGAMLAIQVGVPAGVIAHDSRTFEMCTTMGVPVVMDGDVEGPLTAERLPELFPFDADAFLDKRRTLHGRYSQILHDAQIDTVDPLKLMF